VVCEKGVIRRDKTAEEENRNFVPDDLSNYQVVRVGQFAMNKMKAWQGSYGISAYDGIASPAYFVFNVSGVESRFFHSAIRSRAYVPSFTQASDGVRIGQWDLSEIRMREIAFAIPPLSEQDAIVRFVDHADRRIRRYIGAKQRLIKLLEEQKQAIINRAVTRGLDPNVRLKPSGLEWLSDIPEHWEVRRNGRLFLQRDEIGFADLPILEVSLRTGVRVRDFENSERKQVMTDRGKYKRTVAGDIAYNMMRMWQGAVGVVPVDGLISPAYVVAKPLSGTEPRYFARLFKTAAYLAEVDKFSRGIVKDRNRLYWEDFKRMCSCYPPPHEQRDIADTVDAICSEFDESTHRVRQEIDLLREYRTRLIADVVTGKLDVREAASRLPEESAEEEQQTPEEPELDSKEAGDYMPEDEELLEVAEESS
jgi:type I restriction enzyme S subunit